MKENYDVTQLTETSVDQFKIFVKFLAENDLLEKATEHLKSNGMDKIRVSIEVIQEIQAFIQKEYESRESGVSRDAKMVIMSGHTHC